MTEYTVKITEVRTYTYVVEAEGEELAIEAARDRYFSGGASDALESSDFDITEVEES